MQAQQLQVLDILIEKRKAERDNRANGNDDRSRKRYPSAGPEVTVTDTNNKSHRLLKSVQKGAKEVS